MNIKNKTNDVSFTEFRKKESENKVSEIKESYIQINKLENELARIQNQVQNMTIELINSKQQNAEIRAMIRKKQDVASRLIGQRNTAKFQNDKIVVAIKEALISSNCSVAKEANIDEMLNALVRIVKDSWNSQKEIVRERNFLKESLQKSTEVNKEILSFNESIKLILASYQKKYGNLKESDYITREKKSDKSKSNRLDFNTNEQALASILSNTPDSVDLPPFPNSIYINASINGSPSGYEGDSPEMTDWETGNLS